MQRSIRQPNRFFRRSPPKAVHFANGPQAADAILLGLKDVISAVWRPLPATLHRRVVPLRQQRTEAGTIRSHFPDARLSDPSIEDGETQSLSVRSPRNEARRLVRNRCEFPHLASIPLADVNVRVDGVSDLLVIRRWVNVMSGEISKPADGSTRKGHQPVWEWTSPDIAPDDQLRSARRNIIQPGI